MYVHREAQGSAGAIRWFGKHETPMNPTKPNLVPYVRVHWEVAKKKPRPKDGAF